MSKLRVAKIMGFTVIAQLGATIRAIKNAYTQPVTDSMMCSSCCIALDHTQRTQTTHRHRPSSALTL